MPQRTLHGYLKRRSPPLSENEQPPAQFQGQEEIQGSVDDRYTQPPSALCQRESIIRTLQGRSCGIQPAKYTRKHLHMYGYAGYQQLAGLLAGGMDSSNGQSAITSVDIRAGTAAFVQANGVLSLYGMGLLQQDAEAISRRPMSTDFLGPGTHPTGDRESQGLRLDPYAYASGYGQPSSDDNEGDGCAEDRGRSDHTNLGGHATGAWLNYGSKVRSHRRACTSRAWSAAQARRDMLPEGGARFNMGSRLDDVAWDPRVPCHTAIAGSSNHNVQVINVEEGRRKRTQLVPKQVPSNLSGPGLTSVKYFDQGPYTLAAAGRNSQKILLWDQRRSPIAVAEISTPGRVPLQSPLEVSADGTVLYGVAGNNLLLMWDVRKGSQGSGVLHFGGSGPYYHALFGSMDLNAPLAAAQAQHVCGPQGRTLPGLDARDGLPPPAPVDQVLVNPCSPSRLGLVLQNCGTAVLDLGTGRLTHSCLPPNLYHSTSLSAPSRYSWTHKRGTWDPQGHALWVPHAWLPVAPVEQQMQLTQAQLAPQPSDLHPAAQSSSAPSATFTRLLSLADLAGREQQQCDQLQQQQQQQQEATRLQGGGAGFQQNAGHLGNGTAAELFTTQPSVAALDCRVGGSSITSTARGCSASDLWNKARGADSSSSSSKKCRVADASREADDRRVLQRPWSNHALGACEPPELTAAMELLCRSYARSMADPYNPQAAADFLMQQAAATCVRQEVYRPSVLVPVSDWVTCVSCDPDTGVLLAGSYAAELLLLGQGMHGSCCFT